MRKLKFLILDKSEHLITIIAKIVDANILKELINRGFKRMIALSGPYSELYVVNEEQFMFILNILNNTNRHPYCAGIYVAKIDKKVNGKEPIEEKDIRISLTFAELVFTKFNLRKSIVVINDWGEKLALYGRDIMAGSIIDMYPPILKGKLVIIANRINEFIGFGTPLYNYNEIIKLRNKQPTQIVIRNEVDLGWYLRKGG